MRIAGFLTLLVMLGGCATEGPKWWSGQVHGAAEGKTVAQYGAETNYWDALGQSYRAGGGGLVDRDGPSMRAPANYQRGVLINLTDYDVTFQVTPVDGAIGTIQHVGRHGQAIAELPPGKYQVVVIMENSGGSWNFFQLVDDVRNSVVYDKTPYDFSMIARR